MFKFRVLPFYEGDDGSDVGGAGGSDDNLSGEELLQNAIRDLLADKDEDEDLDIDDDNQDDGDKDDDQDDSDDKDDDNEDDDKDEDKDEDDQKDEDDVEDDDKAKGKKREQSKEENAKFAAQRREKELQDRVNAELAKIKESSAEFQLAKVMADMYGVTPEVALEQMKAEALKQQSQKTGIPVEVLQKQQQSDARVSQLEQEINNLRFQQWQNQILADTSKLQKQYKFLTKDDFKAAEDYILNVARNVNIPLEQAIYAVHGAKIVENLANNKLQNNLAEQSGRSKKTPLKPNNGKVKDEPQGTADERYIAKQMGISIKEYLKYKV